MRRLTVLVGLLLLFSGCTTDYQQGELKTGSYAYVIGVSQANLIEPWRIAFHNEIHDLMPQDGNVRLITADAARSAERQIKDIERMQKLGVDLLIVSPVDNTVAAAIGAAHKRIPVIVLDQDIYPANYTLFISADNYKIGKMAGEAVKNALGGSGGRVLEIGGLKDSPRTNDISRGFREAITPAGNITVVDVLYADWLRDSAEQHMRNFLILNPKVDMVFAHNDAMAYGSAVACQQLRVTGVRFIGVPGTAVEKSQIGQEVVSVSFFQPTGAKETIDYAWKILNKQRVPSHVTIEPIVLPN